MPFTVLIILIIIVTNTTTTHAQATAVLIAKLTYNMPATIVATMPSSQKSIRFTRLFN